MSEMSAIPDRRARFRDLVSRLDGSGAPGVALEHGLYVRRPDGGAERLAASLEIRPTGTHLVVGSVGSGKTTDLLRLQAALREAAPELEVDYRDAGASGVQARTRSSRSRGPGTSGLQRGARQSI